MLNLILLGPPLSFSALFAAIEEKMKKKVDV